MLPVPVWKIKYVRKMYLEKTSPRKFSCTTGLSVMFRQNARGLVLMVKVCSQHTS